MAMSHLLHCKNIIMPVFLLYIKNMVIQFENDLNLKIYTVALLYKQI